MLSMARTAAVNRKLENREEVKKRFARVTLRLSPATLAHMERLSMRCVFRLFEPPPAVFALSSLAAPSTPHLLAPLSPAGEDALPLMFSPAVQQAVQVLQ